jgi:hypothetical protein
MDCLAICHRKVPYRPRNTLLNIWREIVLNAQILPFPGTQLEPFRLAAADRPLAAPAPRQAAKSAASNGEPTTFQRCLALHMFCAARISALD